MIYFINGIIGVQYISLTAIKGLRQVCLGGAGGQAFDSWF